MGRFSRIISSSKRRGQRQNERVAATNNDKPTKGSLESSQNLEALAISTRPEVSGARRETHISGLALE